MLTGWRKARLRKSAKIARAAANAAHPDAGRALVDHFPDAVWPPLNSIVAGYRPIHSEIDPTCLMETFHCEQARLALPCVEADNAPLVFRSFAPGDALERRAYGVEAPGLNASIVRPTLFLVPMLAFDRAGRRLGYGGGYYDRTLATLRSQGPITAVGLAFEAQRVKSVPASGRDQRLDWVVTEVGAFQAGA